MQKQCLQNLESDGSTGFGISKGVVVIAQVVAAGRSISRMVSFG
jgi:hypothetical protein